MQVKFYPLEEDAQFIVRNAMTSLIIFGTIVKKCRKHTAQQKVVTSFGTI